MCEAETDLEAAIRSEAEKADSDTNLTMHWPDAKHESDR
jgi:hypothetical protein